MKTSSGIKSTIVFTIINNRELRAAMRLYAFISHEVGPMLHFQQANLLREHFSTYQIQKYTSTLRKYGFIGVDKQGTIYLRSQDFIARTLEVYADCPKVKFVDGCTHTDVSWKEWLAGGGIVRIASNLKYGKSRTKARVYGAEVGTTGDHVDLFFWNNVATVFSRMRLQGVALSIIQKVFNCSKSTASRLRKMGERTGMYFLRRVLRFQGDVPSGVEGSSIARSGANVRYGNIIGVELPSVIIF